MLPGGSRSYNLPDLAHIFLGGTCTIQIGPVPVDLYHTDPAQHLTTAGYDLDDLDHDLSDLSKNIPLKFLVACSLNGGPVLKGDTR